jgi:hypothetical protein
MHSFIVFDVVEFYPSISVELLNSALMFANQYDKITDEEKHIIIHAKRSLLFKGKENWGKKTSNNLFDVTMGSYDGAETCELIGWFILHLITKKHGNGFGLYRDDGLGVIRATARTIESIKKDLCNIFREHGLRITIEANKKVVNFLDVTLNLTNGNFKPYIKTDNHPQYVHSKSNHPPSIISNIPASINKRLSDISCDAATFEQATPMCQAALERSGYSYQLSYRPTEPRRISRKRHRKITWYNPPFSRNVATNIGKEFLTIIDRVFHRQHPLHKIFNRNNIKISYSCMTNFGQTISMHNKSLLTKQPDQAEAGACNCRNKANCPLPGKCTTEGVIYQATVVTDNNSSDETYVGLTESTFKTRYGNHKNSFKHAAKRSSTELSKYIWGLKDKNINFNIIWRILKRAQPYSNTSKKCNLCIWEKYFIIYRPQLATLNRRNKLVSTCRHASKHLLSNTNPQHAIT